VIPHAHTAIKQHRAFSIVGPSAWTSLPSELCSLPQDLSSSFYRLLKTCLFAQAWSTSELLLGRGAIQIPEIDRSTENVHEWDN